MAIHFQALRSRRNHYACSFRAVAASRWSRPPTRADALIGLLLRLAFAGSYLPMRAAAARGRPGASPTPLRLPAATRSGGRARAPLRPQLSHAPSLAPRRRWPTDSLGRLLAYVFSNGTDPTVGSNSNTMVLGDVDGDLDLVTTNGLTSGTISVLLNGGNGQGGGTGTFSNPSSSTSSVAVGNTPRALALADLDDDGDLDMLATNALGNTVSVRLNHAPAYSLSRMSPAAELPGQVVTLTGMGFTSGSTVSIGGVAALATYVSPTMLTAVGAAGAAPGIRAVAVTMPGLGSVSATAFAVLAVYEDDLLDVCAAAVPATASVCDGAWHYLMASNGQVVAAYSYTGAPLGDLAVDVLRATSKAPVRQDAAGRAYLDRNFHLTASGGRFDGRTVGLRFYGFTTEQARLQAADATAVLASLQATQYSGPNEDCDPRNNSASGERRTLAAPATAPAGTRYFVAELAVADHFSEFYLTGSSTPLPVKLTTFTAALASPTTVRLAWTTASEQNSLAFEVERSLDGQQFVRLGTVAAAGSSSALRHYELLDAQLTLLYYRLRQVDQDGTFSYSPVRTVALAGAAAWPGPISEPRPHRRHPHWRAAGGSSSGFRCPRSPSDGRHRRCCRHGRAGAARRACTWCAWASPPCASQ